MIIAITVVALLAVAAFIFFRVMPAADMENKDTLANNTTNTMDPENAQVAILPIEHASFAFLLAGRSVYVDPVGEADAYVQAQAPDLILVTDIHADHFSTSTLEALATPDTQLIVPQAVADLLPASLLERSYVLANGEETTQKDLRVEAVPMYNVPESDDAYHVKGRGNGYIVEAGNVRVYIAGDTGPIPEMNDLSDIDVAFVPMNLPYTMSVEDAAEAVVNFAPRSVYPYHYRTPDGFSDVERFKELVNEADPTIEVQLLDWYHGV